MVNPFQGGMPLLLGLCLAGPWLAGQGLLGPATAQAHSRGLYANQEDAARRASELKCKGTFKMGTLWMPCANERALHKALQQSGQN